MPKFHVEAVVTVPMRSTLTVMDESVVSAVITPSMKLAVLALFETRTRFPTMYPPVRVTAKVFEPVATVVLVTDVAPP